jgi:hypothetical protein
VAAGVGQEWGRGWGIASVDDNKHLIFMEHRYLFDYELPVVVLEFPPAGTSSLFFTDIVSFYGKWVSLMCHVR